MKKVFQVLILLTVVVVGIGFYRGWFALSREDQAESHNVDVRLSVDTDKVKNDTAAITGGSQQEDAENEK